MGQRLIITEEERRSILSLYEQNDNGDFIISIYNKIKDNPTMKKIDSLYDSNITTFISNVIKNFPSIIGQEKKLTKIVNEFLASPIPLIKKYQRQIENFTGSKLNEQSGAVVILAHMALLGFMIGIAHIVHSRYEKKLKAAEANAYNNNVPPVPEKSEVDKQLEVFNGKTVNLYNDLDEQIIYGRDIIYNPKFSNVAEQGGRSGVTFGFGQGLPSEIKNYLGDYEVPCLSNPDRLAPFIIQKGKYDVQSRKYNKKFTDELSKIASPFCKKPEADFGMRKTSDGINKKV